MPAKTKQCEVCDATIAESETNCPSCGTDLAELEENVKAVESAQTVLEKRKKKAAPVVLSTPVTPPAPTSTFARLRGLHKKG
jgi:hypothetical protein